MARIFKKLSIALALWSLLVAFYLLMTLPKTVEIFSKRPGERVPIVIAFFIIILLASIPAFALDKTIKWLRKSEDHKDQSVKKSPNLPFALASLISILFYIVGFVLTVCTLDKDAQAGVGFFFLPIYSGFLFAVIYAVGWSVSTIGKMLPLQRSSTKLLNAPRIIIALAIFIFIGIGAGYFIHRSHLQQVARTSTDENQLQKIYEKAVSWPLTIYTDHDYGTLLALIENRNCSPNLLQKIWKVAPNLSFEIVGHPNLPIDVLRDLAKSQFEYVADKAQKRLDVLNQSKKSAK